MKYAKQQKVRMKKSNFKTSRFSWGVDAPLKCCRKSENGDMMVDRDALAGLFFTELMVLFVQTGCIRSTFLEFS